MIRFYFVSAVSLMLLLSLNTCPATAEQWEHLSSKNGDIPMPGPSLQQTASLILDVDKDGVNDFIIASRRKGASVLWFRRGADGWTKYIIEPETLQIEAGGTFHDIDGDGDLDIVFGNDASGNRMWWWENPYPNYGTGVSWARREIKSSGGKKHHDQMFGDFDGDGQTEFVTWNQRARKLLLAEIPIDPKSAQLWEFTEIYSWESGKEHEGLAAGDVDGDGKTDIIGGGRWFKHKGGTDYAVEVVDDSQKFTRSAIGQLKKGGRPEIVFGPGDAVGQLKWYEWTDNSWVGHKLLEQDTNHGHSLHLADMNGDGNLDIFCAEMHSPGAGDNCKMRIFYGDGKGNFRLEVISTGIGNHESRLGDLDGDGDVDILTKPYAWDAPRVDVWINTTRKPKVNHNSLDNWAYIQVDSSRSGKAFGLAMGDLTGDGHGDIASGPYFYRNPGGGMAVSWDRVDLPGDVDAMLIVDVDGDDLGDIIAESLPDVYWLEAADAQGASWNATKVAELPKTGHKNGQGYILGQIVAGGKPEILLSTGKGVYYLEIPADPSAGNWQTTNITHETSEEGIGVGDIDGDGDVDIAAGTEDGDVAWWENPGDGTANWKKHPVGVTVNTPDRVAVADVNLDGRPDVVVSEETRLKDASVYWFQQPGGDGGWIRHKVVTQFTSNSMDVGDMDDDGDVDIITGEHRGAKKLIVWENVQKGSSWVKHVVATGKESHLGARIADLDGDGDMEIASIAWDDYKYLYLWRNDARFSVYNEVGQTASSPVPVIKKLIEKPAIAAIMKLPANTPEADHQVALYRFQKGEGNVTSSAIMESPGDGLKIIAACRVTNEISIEAWIKPARTDQSGPARIVSLSTDLYNRNFTLGQDGTAYNVRLRTTKTSKNADKLSLSAPNSVKTELTHVVYTRDRAGTARIYINGVEKAHGVIGGDFSNWDKGYHLALANEFTKNRPWLGDFHLIAIYSRALTSDEVVRRYKH